MIDVTEAIKGDVRRFCSGVPDYVVEAAIESGCRRFFLESQIWAETQILSADSDAISVLPNTPGCYISDVVEVTTKYGRRVDATYKAGAIHLPGNPNSEIIAEIALCPEEPTAPPWAYPLHKDAFVHAAAKELKAQQDQPWSDPEGAKYHERQYLHWLGVARIQQTPTAVTPCPFI